MSYQTTKIHCVVYWTIWHMDRWLSTIDYWEKAVFVLINNPFELCNQQTSTTTNKQTTTTCVLEHLKSKQIRNFYSTWPLCSKITKWPFYTEKTGTERPLYSCTFRKSSYLGSCCFNQTDGIYRVLIIYRNLWSLVRLEHFMTFTMIWFFSSAHNILTLCRFTWFGVCFEMGKKCYRMSALNITSIWFYVEC